jgi:hypothetical protein
MMKNSTYSFIEDGFKSAGPFFSSEKTRELHRQALNSRNFRDIFLDETEFRAAPKFTGVNPRPGRNLLEKLDSNFIFGDERFQAEMAKVLGPRWRILDHKFVMGVPDEYLPQWVRDDCKGRFVANLGCYVKEQYRDFTYFRGIDFHQDIIDFPDRESDFITAYIYLDDVMSNCSPLYVLPKSHQLGASVFPHKIEKDATGNFGYENDFGGKGNYECLQLTGPAGSLYYWHADTLHGTQPHVDEQPRISVRILAEKNSKAASGCELDEANARLNGPLSLTKTRQDLDERGKATIRGNKINQLI